MAIDTERLNAALHAALPAQPSGTEVGRVLRTMSYQVSREAILEESDPCASFAEWYAGARAGLEESARLVIKDLRDRGASWTDLGRALGVSRQAAWERWRTFDELAQATPPAEVAP